MHRHNSRLAFYLAKERIQGTYLGAIEQLTGCYVNSFFPYLRIKDLWPYAQGLEQMFWQDILACIVRVCERFGQLGSLLW